MQYFTNNQTSLLNLSQRNLVIKSLPGLLYFSLFFIVNPFFAIGLLFIYLLFGRQNNIILSTFACFLIALFNGLVNSTKVPENDLVWYLAGYLDAGRMPFLKYIFSFGLTGTGKELGFSTFNYFLYLIAGDNTKLYIILYTFFAYSFLNLAVLKFGKSLNIPRAYVLTAVFVMAFTPFIFTMSAQLLRQFLAASVLMYILVNKLFYGKNSILLILFMIFCHSSAIFFVPYLFMPFLKKTFSVKTLLLLCGIFGIQIIASIGASLFSSIPLLKYAFDRASKNTVFELEPLTPAKIITVVVITILPFYFIYYLKPLFKDNKGLVHFFNILAILSLFILANLSQAELSSRFNFYLWPFFPFIFLIYAWHFKFGPIQLQSIIIFLLATYVYYLDAGTWTYRLGNGIFSNTFLNYL